MHQKALSELLLAKKVNLDQVVFFLSKRKLLTILPGVLAELKKRKNEEDKKGELLIESPFPLSEDAVKTIREYVGVESETSVRVVTKKSLLAGFRAVYKSKVYDASAQRIIKQLTA